MIHLPYHHSTMPIGLGAIPLPRGWSLRTVQVPDRYAHQRAIDDPRLVRIGQIGRLKYAPDFILYALAPAGFSGVVKTPYGFTHLAHAAAQAGHGKA
jgi:hypothetical protein